MVGEEICGAVVSVRFQVSCSENWPVLPFGRATKSPHLLTPSVLFRRRILSRYGTRQPATRPRQPGYATRYEECSTYLPTPSWNIKHTPTASSTCGGRGRARCWLHACLSSLVQGTRIEGSAHVRCGSCRQQDKQQQLLPVRFESQISVLLLCCSQGHLVLIVRPYSF